jgi:Rrf2 family transcriptional regulator, iron-sulfur cluster assembly transcription factor
MRLRSQTHAALCALLDLSLHSAYHAPVPVSDIARRQGLGTAFLEQLLRPLKKASLVAPWRGMKGGYTLAKPAEEISLLDILRALDDPVVRPAAGGAQPGRAEAQAAVEALGEVELRLAEALSTVSLAELRRRAQANPALQDAPRAGAGFQI